MNDLVSRLILTTIGLIALIIAMAIQLKRLSRRIMSLNLRDFPSIVAGRQQYPKKERVDVFSGLAIAISFFVDAIFLFFNNNYFGSLTSLVAIVCIAIGFIGMGFEIDSITNQDFSDVADPSKGPDISGNLTLGGSLLIAWLVLYQVFSSTVLINLLATPLFCFASIGATMVIVNLLVFVMARRNPKKDDLAKDTHKLYLFIAKALTAIAGIIGFIASLLQILQFLKIL